MSELQFSVVDESGYKLDMRDDAIEPSKIGFGVRHDAEICCTSETRSTNRIIPTSPAGQLLQSPQFPEPIVTSPNHLIYFENITSPTNDTRSKTRGRSNTHQILTTHHSVVEANSKVSRKNLSLSYQTFTSSSQDKKIKTLTPMSPGLFTSLESPCFFHQRFDDVLNFDRLIEAIRDNEAFSHSRLMATATGVREISKQLQRRPFKRAIKNVMIVTKARDNELVTLTKELALWLMKTPRYGSDLGVNVYVDAKLERSKRFGAAEILEYDPRLATLLRYWKPEICRNEPEIFDLVITLGGDGTVLFTSWLFQRIVPPILSFSLGSLGFLTNFEFDKFQSELNKVMEDEGMRVSMRMRFSCTVYKADESGEPRESESYEVLNEVVIDRGPSPYVSNLELYGEDELLTVVQADGCIFATPTGSTAYSLSAGGSLVHPDIPGILLTPICPHTLSFRPLILSDTLLLRVAIPQNSRATAYCAFDGKARVELKQGDSITIAASQYPFPTVMKSASEWFNSVSNSLKWNTRGATQKGWVSQEKEKSEETKWDIDFDDSAYGTSEENSVLGSP